ncbi:MAG: hypothetical protein V4708_17055 [Bacteroidota bacterium]
MSGIAAALFKGYTSRTVLNHLARQSPRYGNAINNAIHLGYAGTSILRAITGDKNIPNEGQLTAFERYKKSIKANETKRAMKVVGTLGTGAAIGAAAYGIFKGAPSGSPRNPQVLGPATPGPSGAGLPPAPTRGPTTLNQPRTGIPYQSPRPGLPQHGGPQPNKSYDRPSVIQAGYEKRPTKLSPERQSIMNKLPEKKPSPYEIKATQVKSFPQLTDLVERSLSFGRSPEEIYEHVKGSKFYSGIVNEVEQKTGVPFIETINQFKEHQMKEQGSQEQIPQQSQTQEQPPQVENTIPVEVQKLPEVMPEQPAIIDQKQPESSPIFSHEEKKSPKSIEKGSAVMTPTGAGTVKTVKGQDAYIEEDGKLKKVPLGKLEEPSEGVREAVHRILDIPEEDRSSNVSLFTYDPIDSRAYFQFHNGESYVYLDMDPEIVRNIAEKNAVPITSGKNIYGEWSPDDKESLGASLWAYILKNPKYKKSGKGEEPNPFYRKLDTKYDYYKKLRIQSKRKK